MAKRYTTKDQSKASPVTTLVADGVAVDPAAPAAEAAPDDGVKVIDLKAKRQVTRYTLTYKGKLYDSPRKALDAAGLTTTKGSTVRTVLKDQPVGTVVRIEGHEFTYSGAPVK